MSLQRKLQRRKLKLPAPTPVLKYVANRRLSLDARHTRAAGVGYGGARTLLAEAGRPKARTAAAATAA